MAGQSVGNEYIPVLCIYMIFMCMHVFCIPALCIIYYIIYLYMYMGISIGIVSFFSSQRFFWNKICARTRNLQRRDGRFKIDQKIRFDNNLRSPVRYYHNIRI